MSSISAEHGFATIFGGKKPDTPDRSRFYACELKFNAWSCRPTQEKSWKPAPDTLATQLIAVNNWVPEFFDPAVISLKLRKPVIVKKEPPY